MLNYHTPTLHMIIMEYIYLLLLQTKLVRRGIRIDSMMEYERGKLLLGKNDSLKVIR